MTLSYTDLTLPTYKNTRIIGAIGSTPLTVTDVINANLLARNNVFLAGKKGTGKTQVVRDLYRHRYGGRGMMIEGRPDLKVSELYTHANLQKLREGTARSSEEIIELAQAVDWPFIGVDELNRAPEITQNELLSILNGYLLHQGRPIPLGGGNSVGVATGNLGNGGYVGTFKIDDALMDRLHLFLDLDFYKPTDEDMIEIDDQMSSDPRVRDAPIRDIAESIQAAQQEVTQIPLSLEAVIAARYMERALDYCDLFPSAGNSKDNLKEAWPTICVQKNCPRKETSCARVKAIGERTVRAAKRCAQGLQYVAKLKDPQAEEDHLGALLLAMRLMLPSAGVISPAYARSEGNFNNLNLTAQHIMDDLEQEIRREFFAGGQGPLTNALAFAAGRKLQEHPYQPTNAAWKFVEPLLHKINKEAESDE